jgi:hypothetical protein
LGGYGKNTNSDLGHTCLYFKVIRDDGIDITGQFWRKDSDWGYFLKEKEIVKKLVQLKKDIVIISRQDVNLDGRQFLRIATGLSLLVVGIKELVQIGVIICTKTILIPLDVSRGMISWRILFEGG